MAYKIDSTQYTHLENIGILYFNLRNLDSAEFYFKKSLLTGKSTNGNSDYFIGLALLEKNRKDEACKYFLNAKNKGNTAAYEKIKINCSNL